MATINVSESDFAEVAGAANDAKRRGDMDSANNLDKIARKINAALANGSVRHPMIRGQQGLTWRDVPSTLI